jgi:hypothetical protein
MWLGLLRAFSLSISPGLGYTFLLLMAFLARKIFCEVVSHKTNSEKMSVICHINFEPVTLDHQ